MSQVNTLLEACARTVENECPALRSTQVDRDVTRALIDVAKSIRSLGALATKAPLDRVREVAAGVCEGLRPPQGAMWSQSDAAVYAALSAAARRVRTVELENGYRPIVTAPASDGFGRISAYDTTWPDLHDKHRKRA